MLVYLLGLTGRQGLPVSLSHVVACQCFLDEAGNMHSILLRKMRTLSRKKYGKLISFIFDLHTPPTPSTHMLLPLSSSLLQSVHQIHDAMSCLQSSPSWPSSLSSPPPSAYTFDRPLLVRHRPPAFMAIITRLHHASSVHSPECVIVHHNGLKLIIHHQFSIIIIHQHSS